MERDFVAVFWPILLALKAKQDQSVNDFFDRFHEKHPGQSGCALASFLLGIVMLVEQSYKY